MGEQGVPVIIQILTLQEHEDTDGFVSQLRNDSSLRACRLNNSLRTPLRVGDKDKSESPAWKELAALLSDDRRMKIRTLDLSGNDVGREGCQSLGKLLAGNLHVVHLDISDNGIAKPRVGDEVRCKGENCTLKTVELDKHDSVQILNPAGTAVRSKPFDELEWPSWGIRAFAAQMRHNAVIQTLDISSNWHENEKIDGAWMEDDHEILTQCRQNHGGWVNLTLTPKRRVEQLIEGIRRTHTHVGKLVLISAILAALRVSSDKEDKFKLMQAINKQLNTEEGKQSVIGAGGVDVMLKIISDEDDDGSTLPELPPEAEDDKPTGLMSKLKGTAGQAAETAKDLAAQAVKSARKFMGMTTAHSVKLEASDILHKMT